LPENPGDAWNYLTEDVIDRSVYRLGNLTLLEKNINKDIGTDGFEDKKAAYAKSSIQVTRSINEHYSEWTEETICKRQARLAVEAKSIWRLQF